MDDYKGAWPGHNKRIAGNVNADYLVQSAMHQGVSVHRHSVDVAGQQDRALAVLAEVYAQALAEPLRARPVQKGLSVVREVGVCTTSEVAEEY